MPSIDSRSIVEQLIANRGCYDDDPPVISIYEYTTQWGGICWFVAYDDNDLLALAHGVLRLTVQAPRLLYGRSYEVAVESRQADTRLLSRLTGSRH